MKPDSDWKESGSLSVEYKYDRLQWSSAVYESYIYIFGGDSGKILWIDVGVEPYKQGEKLQRLPRWSEGVAFVQNFHGQPAFLSFGGRFKGEASSLGEFLFVDSDTSEDFSQQEMRPSKYDTKYGPAMAQIGDNIVFIQTDPTTHPQSTGKDILLWSYNDARPKIVGGLSKNRNWGSPAVVSGRFFSKCAAENQLKYKQTYTNCLDAYTTSGFISPKSSNSVKIMLNDDSQADCEFENVYDQSKKCPKGWIGKANEGSCYKIYTNPLGNQDAAQICYQEGAELVQIESQMEDDMINEILLGASEYSTPTHPGFYHIGLYQRQEGNLYYHRSGIRV